jgi:hypothetical protein
MKIVWDLIFFGYIDKMTKLLKTHTHKWGNSNPDNDVRPNNFNNFLSIELELVNFKSYIK